MKNTEKGKIPFHLVRLDFVRAMAENFFEGIKNGREPNDWKKLDWCSETELEYAAKIMRHLYHYLNSEDPKVKKRHAAAGACNFDILDFWAEAGKEPGDTSEKA